MPVMLIRLRLQTVRDDSFVLISSLETDFGKNYKIKHLAFFREKNGMGMQKHRCICCVFTIRIRIENRTYFVMTERKLTGAWLRICRRNSRAHSRFLLEETDSGTTAGFCSGSLKAQPHFRLRLPPRSRMSHWRSWAGS